MSDPAAQGGPVMRPAPTAQRGATGQARKLSNRLLVAIRDDVAAHDRVGALLRAQEASVVRPADPAFRSATESLESELERLPFRTSQRDRIIRDLGAEFGIEPSTLTLRSIAERLGSGGQPLLIEGARLRASVKEVQRLNRRVAALVRMHREVTREILNTVLGDGSGREILDGGTLIDAEV